MFLEQIERKQKQQKEQIGRASVRRRPMASELDPRKKLRQSDQGVETRDKTMGLKLGADTHERLNRLKKLMGMKSKTAVALKCLELGLFALEEKWGRRAGKVGRQG